MRFHKKWNEAEMHLIMHPPPLTDTWGQLVLLTTILNHKTCINTSRQVLEKTLFAINAIFTQDNNLSKNESRGVPAENKRYMFKM